jgi:hypothetical protein
MLETGICDAFHPRGRLGGEFSSRAREVGCAKNDHVQDVLCPVLGRRAWRKCDRKNKSLKTSKSIPVFKTSFV